MVSTAEQEALGNFTYACVADDYIWLVHRADPRFDLRLLFDELLTFLADNLSPDTLLPLLDLVELDCEFLAGIRITDNPESVAKAPTKPIGNAADPTQV